MGVNIQRALRDGVDRTFARNGLYLIVITFVLTVLIGLFANTIAVELIQSLDLQQTQQPASQILSLGLSAGVAGVLMLIVWLITIAVTAATLRTFVTDETETIPTEYFTRNYGWMLLSLIIGGIIFGIAVGIGTLLLIVPGIFLLVSLYFWNVYVIVEDENFVDAFSDSWALTKGNRWSLLALGVIVVILETVVFVVLGFIPGTVGLVVTQIGTAIVGVFALATTARTYVQLTDGAEASQ